MEASAAGGEPALSSDTSRCTLGSPGRIGRKEGGKEEHRALAAWPGGPAVGVKALRTQTASALHSGAIKHVQHAPCVNRLSISHSSFFQVRPSVPALAGSSGPSPLSVGGPGFSFCGRQAKHVGVCRNGRTANVRLGPAASASLLACLLLARRV